MVILFLAPLMLALALMFIWVGFRGHLKMTLDEDRAAWQKRQLKKRLSRLQTQLQQGQIDQQQFDLQQAELARPILDELDARSSRLRPARRANLLVLLSLLLLTPVLALILYWQLGAHQGILLYQQLQAGAATPAQERQMLATWEAWLERKPRDVDGWYVVGRSYMSLGDYDQAESAFLRGLEALSRFESPRVEDQAALYAHLAQVRFLANQGMDGIADEYLATALRLADDDRTANALAAIVNYQQQEYLLALRHLEQVLALPMPEVERASFEYLQEQAQLGFIEEGGDPLQLATLAGQGFVLEIDRASFLAQEDLPVLFITAHQPGNSLPLAVRRISVDQWPVQTSLTDRHLMTSFQQFNPGEPLVVQARLSRTGNAVATAEDWVSSPLTVATPEGVSSLELVVDEPWQESR